MAEDQKTQVPAVRQDVKYEVLKPTEKMSFLERKLRAIMPRFETMLGDPEKAKMLIYVALNALRKEPKLLNCTPESFIRSINHCSDIGLFPNTPENHAYLIPFKTECQVMIDYKGYVALAHRVPKIVKLWAELVYKGDEFHHELGANPNLVHIPNYDAERTLENLTGAYAVVKYTDGDTQWVYMTRKELDKVKAVSRAKDGDAWRMWPEEMYRKAPLRRLMKYVPWSPHMMKAVALDNAATVGDSQDMPMVTAGAKEADYTDVTDLDPEPIGNGQSTTQQLADKLHGKANGKKTAPPEDRDALVQELITLLDSNDPVIPQEIIDQYPVNLIKKWDVPALKDAIHQVQLYIKSVVDDVSGNPDEPSEDMFPEK